MMSSSKHEEPTLSDYEASFKSIPLVDQKLLAD